MAKMDIDSPGFAKNLSKRILNDIDEYCIKTYDGGHRWHLGASLIGHPCKRYLWYVFRWCFREKADGRKQRLFNRGHREEARFIEFLEGIGCEVFYENYENFYFHAESDSYLLSKEDEVSANLTCDAITKENPYFKEHVARAKIQGIKFPQFRVSAVNGHFGGSLDAIVILPERYGVNEPILAEFKTNGTGRGFNKLVESGMLLAKPLHFAQTSLYGTNENYNFHYVLYLNVNKNDDTLYIEFVKLDKRLGERLVQKAEEIIISKQAPSRLSENPTYQDCVWCSAKGICHKGEIVEKNCRSCAFSNPVDNGEWFCEIYKDVVPRTFIPKACREYKTVNSN